jgi:N-acetylglucosamine kinase-like BadF-type ATPase
LQQADLESGAVESFGFGLAGATGAAQKEQWRSALRALYGEAIVVDEDVAAALAGALGESGLGAGGAVLIAGTGANCFGQAASGERRRADGWGPLLGDRGSGYWLGEAGIRAAVAALDEAAPATALSRDLLRYFECDDLHAVVATVYAPDFRRDRVAGFVPLILQAARAGDAVSQGLLSESGRLLGATAASVLAPLGVETLALTGGLIENAPEIQNALRKYLSEAVGAHIQTCEPQFEAVVGAALLS